MSGNSKESDSTELAHQTLAERIHAVYASDDQSAANEVTKLLVNALRGAKRSRLALSRFFSFSRMKTVSGAKLDLVLVSRVRLFVNNLNAHRVQDWILCYERSAPHSQRRST
jgi:hypothetical protein